MTVRDLPQAGYKAVTIRDDAYNMAKQEAERQEVSIGEIILKAVNRYVNKRVEREETIKAVLDVIEKAEAKEGSV